MYSQPYYSLSSHYDLYMRTVSNIQLLHPWNGMELTTANMRFIYSVFRRGFKVRIVVHQLVRLVGRSGSLVQREQ